MIEGDEMRVNKSGYVEADAVISTLKMMTRAHFIVPAVASRTCVGEWRAMAANKLCAVV